MDPPFEYDSSKFIQNFNFLMGDVSALKETLDSHDDKLLTLINQNALIVSSLQKLAQEMKQSSRQKSKHKDRKKINSANKKGSGTNWSHLLHLPTALQQNITKFIKDFAFQSTQMQDQLIEEGFLSDSERETICSRPSQADQIRLLIKKIKGRGPEKIEKFLEHLGKDKANAHLVTAVYETVKKNEEQNELKPMCACCMIRKTVDLKDIADHLWENKLISDDVYSSIFEPDVLANMQYLWGMVFHYINNARDPNTAKQVLQNALDSKYNHLVKPLADHQEQVQQPGQGGQLSCTCRARKSLVRQNVLSDFGGSSDYQKALPYWDQLQSENSEAETCPSLESDQPASNLSSISFTNPRKFDDDQIEQSSEEQSGAQMPLERKTTKSRHSSGKFQPEEGDQLESGRCASLPFVSGENLANTGDNGSLNDTTVVCTPDVVMISSSDVSMKTSDSNTTITDTDKGLDLSPKTSDGMTDPSSASPEIKKPKLKLKITRHPRRRQASRHKSVDCSSCPDDNESDEDHSYNRTKLKSIKRTNMIRQRSGRSSLVITKPNPKADSTVFVRTQKVGGKKSPTKLADRRKSTRQVKLRVDILPMLVQGGAFPCHRDLVMTGMVVISKTIQPGFIEPDREQPVTPIRPGCSGAWLSFWPPVSPPDSSSLISTRG